MKNFLQIIITLFLFTSNLKASNFNPGKNSVSFVSYGDTISAHLYLPKEYDENKEYPTIVLTPPATSVKEQTIGIYAEALSKEGYITLAFDPRGWGESQGTPFLLDPSRIVDDTKTAVSYVLTLKSVDKKNVYNMGVCMGAAFSAVATALDARVKALIMVSPYMDGNKQFYQSFGNSPYAVRNSIFQASAQGRQTYFETGEIVKFQAIPENEGEIDQTTMQITKEMMEYYLPGKPGDTPTWVNAFNSMSVEHFLSWSADPYVYLLEPVPTLVIYGENAVTAEGAIAFYQNKKGMKEELIIKDKGHFDLYHEDECVGLSVEKILSFLNALK
jgi:fermentation-respiration switch protein FrsA (DUF1100 family)